MTQWMFRIKQYAEPLLNEFDDLDWPEPVKDAQRAWIGKSEGAEISFDLIDDSGEKVSDLPVFTTRPDTLYGVTYTVLAPEHGLLQVIKDAIQNKQDVEDYQKETDRKTERERLEQKKNRSEA